MPISYAYDADNEEKTETWMNPSGGSALNVVTFTYNADGDVTQIQDANSKYEYGFNADNEVTSQSDLGTTGVPTVTLTYAYDADGDRTSMDDSLGGLVSYTYDGRDELINETLSFSGSASGTSPEAVKDTYDNAGNMTGQTRYSNLAESTVVAVTSYTYDNANQMTGITDKNSGGTTLVAYGYTYNAASLVSQETRSWASGGSTDTLTYGYTNNDQLTSVAHTNGSFSNESFSYDANGNATGTGFTTTTGNEQTASPGYTYTYDANGNMITSTQTSTGDVWTYSYDFRNRMTGAVEKTSGGTVLAQATYTYDALDNRIGMDENGTQTWTLYDGSDPIIDFSGAGSLTMRYLNGPTGDIVDAVLARQSAGGTIAWYLPDRLGTIRDLINNSGSIIDHVDYSAFGTQLGESTPLNGDRMMGFAGMERDTVTGLNLAVHRAQNPRTERWESQDPLGFIAGDTDLSRYVMNNPIASSDPDGLQAPARGGGRITRLTPPPSDPYWIYTSDPNPWIVGPAGAAGGAGGQGGAGGPDRRPAGGRGPGGGRFGRPGNGLIAVPATGRNPGLPGGRRPLGTGRPSIDPRNGREGEPEPPLPGPKTTGTTPRPRHFTPWEWCPGLVGPYGRQPVDGRPGAGNAGSQPTAPSAPEG